MNKAKYDYYNFKSFPDARVDDYVTELEQKAEMFDEMVNILSYSATITRCFPDAMLKDLTEDLNSILERAKKIQRGE